MDNKPKYDQPRRMSRVELENAFENGDGETIGSALLSAFYTEEPSWIVAWCLKFVGHRESVVRRCAIEVLSNTAVLRSNVVNLDVYREAAERLCGDPHVEVKTAALDALDDVMHAMKHGPQS